MTTRAVVDEVIGALAGPGATARADQLEAVEALVDQRVGSRLVVTIPPELATGDDTLVAVVDVLGTSPGPS